MYCKYCGKKLEGDIEVCTECATNIKTENPVQEVQNNNEYTNNNHNSNQNVGPIVTTRKSKLAAGLFGIFLGALGVHNFYLGYTGKAIAQLLITVLTCGVFSFVSAIWGLIEGILILTGDIKTDAYGNSLRD